MTIHRRIAALGVILVPALALMLAPSSIAGAQENPPPQPIDIPCATNASAQVLGATPIGDGSQTLVMARVIFAPGGMISAHTHPGTLVVSVERGLLGFTHLGDREMIVNRAATADTEATAEPLPHGEEIAINPGDSFIETGMVHIGANISDGETTVLLSGVIETGQPLTICVDEGTPTAHA
jgi:hypothetical protein